jgi:hypothetical protein
MYSNMAVPSITGSCLVTLSGIGICGRASVGDWRLFNKSSLDSDADDDVSKATKERRCHSG